VATQDQLAEAYRVEQAQLSAEATRAVLALWLAMYEPGNSQVWRAFLVALTTLINALRGRSSQSAVIYYLESRRAARAPRSFTPRVAPAPLLELIEATAQLTGARMYGRSLSAGMTPERALRNAGVQVAGATSRIVLDAGRQTILDAVEEDREAIGWTRITDAKPCAFCSMLASRGPVYSEDTVSFQAHAHCACIAAPVWSRDEAWLGHSEDLYQQWRAVTEGESGPGALRAWRRYWNNRETASVDA
jgi:hypothetical protein